jgi:hypothetical protein
LAWEAAAEPAAAAGQVVQAAAPDLAAQVAAEQAQVARACGNPAGCRAAAVREQAERARDRDPAVGQGRGAAEERVEEVVQEAEEPALVVLALGVDPEGLAVERARVPAQGRKSRGNG